jgi:hypothetical protein
MLPKIKITIPVNPKKSKISKTEECGRIRPSLNLIL